MRRESYSLEAKTEMLYTRSVRGWRRCQPPPRRATRRAVQVAGSAAAQGAPIGECLVKVIRGCSLIVSKRVPEGKIPPPLTNCRSQESTIASPSADLN